MEDIANEQQNVVDQQIIEIHMKMWETVKKGFT